MEFSLCIRTLEPFHIIYMSPIYFIYAIIVFIFELEYFRVVPIFKKRFKIVWNSSSAHFVEEFSCPQDIWSFSHASLAIFHWERNFLSWTEVYFPGLYCVIFFLGTVLVLRKGCAIKLLASVWCIFSVFVHKYRKFSAYRPSYAYLK